jgi:hypothetical protein
MGAGFWSRLSIAIVNRADTGHSEFNEAPQEFRFLLRLEFRALAAEQAPRRGWDKLSIGQAMPVLGASTLTYFLERLLNFGDVPNFCDLLWG